MPSDATVNVIGQINEGMGGLKESLTTFRKHHQQVGDALLNISGIGTATGEPVDKDEERPKYEFQPYPRHVYHADRREQIVANEAEFKLAVKAGFRADPYPRPQVAVGDPQQEKKELLDRNRALQGEVSKQQELIEQLADRLAALEAKK